MYIFRYILPCVLFFHPGLWGRFMDLEDNTPFFFDRNNIKKSSYSEIGYERRNGYARDSDAPLSILEQY
ncbi:MAG: hypothetical protein KDC85_09150 [Saprospiraceae bacterium]|nr:hypothetical protein [Saprospiraceae bacterium]MCB9326658.1 hypothetical protein [Lewinellaceae bacterium]